MEIHLSRLNPSSAATLVASVRDITERELEGNKLRDSEDKFRSLFDNAQVGMIRTRISNSQIIDINTKAAEIFGCTREDALGMPSLNFWADSNERERAVSLLKANGSLKDFENQVITKNGQIKHCLSSWKLYAEGGFIEVSIMDITERKKVQEEILSKTAFLEAQINSSIDGILVVNENGRNIFENKRSRELWGIPPGIAETNDPSVRLSYVMQKVKNPEQFKGQVQHLLAHPDENLQDKMELIDGTILERYSSSVLDKAGKSHGRIWIFHDVTERTRMENENLKLREKAEVSSRLAAVGEMAAGIAHEINNPLTSIIGFAELLADKADLPEDVKNDLKIISDGSHRVKDIVKRMLTFSRQTKPTKACVNINELIETTLDLRSYVLRTANINVVKQFDHNLHCVVVDPGQMQQVFINLIVNAEYSMKQAHGKGTLTITTEKTGNDVRISFKDDGAGMNRDIKEKIFNPFFTTKGVDEGRASGWL